MKYLLDTNILSYWMRGDETVIAEIKRHPPSSLAIAAVSLAEILYGIEKSPVKKESRLRKIQRIASLVEIVPFDEHAASHYAAIRVQLETGGQIIGERDIQIAAIGSANSFAVVTHNTKEFSRVSDLIVEDWAEPGGVANSRDS